MHYDSGSGTFIKTAFTFGGINQFEDGIFVTPQRIAETTTPEPSSLLLASGLLGLGGAVRRKLLA